jgi:hypothetical protein
MLSGLEPAPKGARLCCKPAAAWGDESKASKIRCLLGWSGTTQPRPGLLRQSLRFGPACRIIG